MDMAVACVAMQQFVQRREGKACHRDAQRCRIAPRVCQQCTAPKTSGEPHCCKLCRAIRAQRRATRQAARLAVTRHSNKVAGDA
jgi:hypothetical protein